MPEIGLNMKLIDIFLLKCALYNVKVVNNRNLLKNNKKGATIKG